MQQLLSKLNIDETMTKPVKRPNVWNKVKDNIPHLANYNYMGDLLFLPQDKNGYKYCFVVVDLATNEFDIEPLKNKEPGTVLKAFQSMFKRNYIKKPYASVRTDAGNEFLGVFHKWLYDHDILHRIAKAGRHRQLANVESLNKQLGRLFNGYLNQKATLLGHDYTEWTDVVDLIRTDLNKLRLKKTDDPTTHKYPIPDLEVPNKYEIGDIVYIKLDEPQNVLGHKEIGRFRMGDMRYDKVPRKITKILYYSGKVPYRYMVTGINNASFDEYDLMKAKEEVEKYVVREIIGKKRIKKKIYYLVWWRKYLKKDATYEPKDELMKDVPKLIAQYEQSLK